jgi:hypothetical protein
MNYARTLAVPLILILSAIPAISQAQKPKNSGKVSYSRLAGKGTPADLSHHKDNSALVLRENARNSTAANLNRIEQQSLHAQSPATKQPRVPPAGVPKLGTSKADKGVPINFSGRAPARNLTITKATGKSTASAPAKPH